ncbi:protein LLP [Anoplophora glabripennis]|uniref:protein LLP n=1 Tax=Anoplophora glabripennis TaxID=217634 RepID=UPI0008755281|nr:protein LLP [Anoplophora glabripennis]XP_018576620.1 protein LLP [Anoplophora glabripennis]XP_018576621.1 protein LLP [Anoplophora glabripennis]
MAKSIRSKWKRKCRAIKRERYGKKELERLKKALGFANEQSGSTDTNVKDISEIVTITSAQEIKDKGKAKTQNVMGDMEVEEIKSKFNTKTLRDEHGAYPVWLHPRKIRKASKKAKKSKAKVNKKNK